MNIMPDVGGGGYLGLGGECLITIPRVGICTNFEIISSPRVGNFDQMRRGAVLEGSHVNGLRAKKAAIFCKILDLV